MEKNENVNIFELMFAAGLLVVFAVLFAGVAVRILIWSIS